MRNRLTLSLGKAVPFLMLMCTLLVNSCKKDLLQPNSKSIGSALSFAEAKQYFEINLKQLALPKKLMSTQGTGNTSQKTTIQDLLYNKQPVWDKAYQKLISTGTAVKIPLDFGDARKIVDEGTQAYVPYSSLNYLFMYKDSLQRIHAEWVYLKPTLNWLKGNRTSFEGSIEIKDWNGKLLKIYHYGAAKAGQLSKLSSVKGTIMGGGNTTPIADGCLIWAVREKCYCNAAWPSGQRQVGEWDPDKCDYCDLCVDYFCMPEPECDNCPPPPNDGGGTGGGNNGGGSGYTPGGNGGGGGTGPGDYEPEDCTNEEPVINPDGTMSPPPCVPEPTCENCLPPSGGDDTDLQPIDPLAQIYSPDLGRTITFGEITEAFEDTPGMIDAIEQGLDFNEHGYVLLPDIITVEVLVEYSALEILHPKWSKLELWSRAYWNVLGGTVHFVLDFAGLVPVVGEAADLTNGVIYFIEGNKLDGAMSLGAAIPIWGWTATGGKWIKNGVKALSRPLADATGKVAFRAIQTTRGGMRLIKVAVGTFSHSALRALKAIKPADKTLTNLSRQLIDQAGQRIAPTLQSLKNKIDDIVLNGDAGAKTESLCDDIFETNGFVKHDAHYGSNNGFDGVYIKKDASGNIEQIIINESKPVGTAGNIKLNGANPATGLGAQMSDKWIYDNVIPSMKAQGGQLEALGDLILNNRSKVTKTVTGVDKATKEIVVLKLASY